MCPPLFVLNFSYRLSSPSFFVCLPGPYNPFNTSFPWEDSIVSCWMSSTWIGYHLSNHRLLSCTLLIRNFMQRAISPVVPKTSKSLKFMMVELYKLMKSYFGTNFIPLIPSRDISQKRSMCIYGNKTESVRSMSRSLTCSTFPLRLPTILTRGLQGSSVTTSLDMVLWIIVALGIHTSLVGRN